MSRYVPHTDSAAPPPASVYATMLYLLSTRTVRVLEYWTSHDHPTLRTHLAILRFVRTRCERVQRRDTASICPGTYVYVVEQV